MAYRITGDIILLGKFILGLSALAFISYGVVGLFSPAIPAGVAGLIINSGDGFAEPTGVSMCPPQPGSAAIDDDDPRPLRAE